MASRSPVITGVGIVAAPGRNVEEVWSALAAQESGLRPLSLFPSPRYGQIPAGEVPHDLCELGAPRFGSRSDRLAWLATHQALASAGPQCLAAPHRTGMVLGSSVGGSFDSERFLATLLESGRVLARPTRFHECHSSVNWIAGTLGLQGPCLTIATACSSGALAIAAAAEFILAGDADRMLAGGADSLSRMTWGGFHSLLLVDESGCRPFDARRAGMTLGEGAAMLVLESEETARARGAPILARLSGWGASCDAHHATAPHPRGEGAAAAMRAALSRAGLDPASIQYLNAHGTGTKDNDMAEAAAMRQVFGDRLPPFSSTKRFFGHALAASGAIEAVVCVEALRRGMLPPNLGCTTPDPAIGAEPVLKPRAASLTHVMSNSFGFGGNNGVLVFSQPNADARPRQVVATPIVVRGVGIIGPGTPAQRDIEPPLPPGQVAVLDCGPLADAAQIPAAQRRRMSRLIRMAVLAARRSHTPNPQERTAVLIGTGMGCLGDAGTFLENLIAKHERDPMPSRFPASVHNAPAAQIAMDLGAHGMNAAPTCGDISFESALWLATRQVAAGEADAALAGAVDELNKYLLSIGRRWGKWTETTRPGEGAVVASLGRANPESPNPLARITAVKLGRFGRPLDPEREADWIEEAVSLPELDHVLSGAGGWPELDAHYAGVVAALNARANGTLEHATYRRRCG